MTQRTLPLVPPRDPCAFDEERPRLRGQNGRILELLRRFERVSNRQLAEISLKYTSRISDLRAAGFPVECVERDHSSGLSWYTLREGSTT